MRPPPLWRMAPDRAATITRKDLLIACLITFLFLPVLSGVYFGAATATVEFDTMPEDLPAWVNRDLQAFTMFHAAAALWSWPAVLVAFLVAPAVVRRGWVGFVPVTLAGGVIGAVTGLVLLVVLQGKWPAWPDLSLMLMIGAGVGIFFAVQCWLFLVLRRADLFLRAPEADAP